MSMYLGRLVCLLLMTLLFGCKSEVTEVLPSKSQIVEWPKVQDSIGNINTYYELTERVLYEQDLAKFAVKKDNLWGVVDHQNNLYYPFEYDTIVSSGNSIALKKSGNYEIYDTSRNLLANIRTDKLKPVFKHFYTSVQNGKLALINPNGMMILDHRFEAIAAPKDESYFIGRMDGSWSAYDMAGARLDSSSRALEAARWYNKYTVSLKAFGPLKIGMTREQIETEIGWKLQELYGDNDGQNACYIYALGDDFPDIHLMLNTENGALALERIYIYAEEMRTKSGIGIGSTKKELEKAYGSKLKEEVAEYGEGALSIYYVPTDRKDNNYRLNFYFRNGVVQEYSVGRLPSILFVEGCL